VGEQAIMDRYSAEPDDRLADLGVVAP